MSHRLAAVFALIASLSGFVGLQLLLKRRGSHVNAFLKSRTIASLSVAVFYCSSRVYRKRRAARLNGLVARLCG
jgi:hypothetical protein